MSNLEKMSGFETGKDSYSRSIIEIDVGAARGGAFLLGGGPGRQIVESTIEVQHLKK